MIPRMRLRNHFLLLLLLSVNVLKEVTYFKEPFKNVSIYAKKSIGIFLKIIFLPTEIFS